MFIQQLLGFLILAVYIFIERAVSKLCRTLIQSHKHEEAKVEILIEATSQETNH